MGRAAIPRAGFGYNGSTYYNWFTEGSDTADLKDAKSLLDQFSDAGS